MGKNIAIKTARAALEMTQQDLAKAVGVSLQTINAIEKGEYNPTIRLCRAICRALGKSRSTDFAGRLTAEFLFSYWRRRFWKQAECLRIFRAFLGSGCF